MYFGTLQSSPGCRGLDCAAHDPGSGGAEVPRRRAEGTVMTSSRGTVLGLGLALGAACLLAGTPARADEEDQARKACRQIAKNRDWKDVDADVRKEGENRIVITMRGERK